VLHIKKIEMPIIIELSELEILKNPTSALFKCNTLIHKARSEIQSNVKGRLICVGDFRGTITSIDKNHVSVKSDSGVEKSLQLTQQRMSQLLKETTQR
jgi:hypothetical protein